MQSPFANVDETTRAIIERITIRYSEPRAIRGGHTCRVFYDCSLLSPNDLARLAAEAAGHLEESTFGMVVGLAYSGVFLAAAVAGGRQVGILETDGKLYGPPVKGKRLLISDDVVYSGSHLLKADQILTAAGAEVVGYVCIVDRSEGQEPPLAKPLWSALRTALE